MTYQVILQRDCKFCGNPMNHCGDRGNGKKRDFCDRECSRKMYMLIKRVENYIAQITLRNNIFDREGEYTENTFKFIQMVNNYLDTGLPAKRLMTHVNAALDGKNAVPVESVFHNIIQCRGKDVSQKVEMKNTVTVDTIYKKTVERKLIHSNKK